MARLISLRTLQTMRGQEREWGYNATDCLATHEIGQKLLNRMEPPERRTYAFERAVQPIAAMMTARGIKVDLPEKQRVSARLTREEKAESAALASDPLITNVWDVREKDTGACMNPTRKDGKHKWSKAENEGDRVCLDCGAPRMRISSFNPNSPDQLKHLLYDLYKMKRQRGKTGEVTTDDDAMGRLKSMYPKHAELIDRILKIKGLRKQLSFLKSKLSPDGRFHASFSVGTTWTGRWASSSDPFNQGNNAQNITEALRGIFIADDGMELCYADLKQAESNIVAHLTGDEGYIEAHKGDTHTFVCRMVWPELPWTGDIGEDKKIAQSHFPEWDNKAGHDYRYQSKAVQHGSNLGLTTFGLAIQRKITVRAATEAQERYFAAFPGIRDWQATVRETVEAQKPLVNPLGVRAKLFGRPWDDHTFKQGYAYLPQSAVAHIINIVIWRLWVELDLPGEIELLGQIHDAILFQYPIEKRDVVLPKVSALMKVPVEVIDIHGIKRVTTIETEAAVGHRWAHWNDNPDKGPVYTDGVKEVKGF